MESDHHKLVTATGDYVHVFAVPLCHFNEMQICLSTKKIEEIPKCKAMVSRFKKWLDDQCRSGRGVHLLSSS